MWVRYLPILRIFGDVLLDPKAITLQASESSPRNQYVRLETIGRKTGRSHQVLVRFITADGKIIIFPQNQSRQDWVGNIRSNPSVRLFGDAHVYSGTALLKRVTNLGDPMLAAFTRKYGHQTVRQRYWGQLDFVELTIDRMNNGIPDQFAYDDLEAAFDGVAEEYDRHIFGNPINTWLRIVSVGLLKQVFKPGDTVLEVGCGTGTETLSLARSGVRVIASDISAKMLEVLEEKARREGLSDHVIPIHCKEAELENKIRSLGFESVDGAYSTYGAINTEPRLNDLFRTLHNLIKPDGVLVLGVWNKYCLYELFGYLLKGKPGLAFARFRNPVPIGKSRFCIASNAYSPSTLGKHLGNYFEPKSVMGVVITLPPSNLTKYMPRGRSLGFFKTLDLRLGRVFPFSRLGDHFLAVYSPRSEGQRIGQ